ncbi:MAG TPA: zf-HC2 domain-containing protein, partial [Planctomycetota bacterium]
MCPDRETLAAYVDRRLPAADRDAYEAHLAACDACRAEAVALWRLVKPASRRFAAPTRVSPWRRLAPWAVAAALLLLAVGLSFRRPPAPAEKPVVVEPDVRKSPGDFRTP